MAAFLATSFTAWASVGSVPGLDADRYLADITNEVVGNGYTTGGATLGTPTIDYLGGTNQLTLPGDLVSWPGSTVTARCAVICDSIPALDKPLLCVVESVSSGDGAFKAPTSYGVRPMKSGIEGVQAQADALTPAESGATRERMARRRDLARPELADRRHGLRQQPGRAHIPCLAPRDLRQIHAA